MSEMSDEQISALVDDEIEDGSRSFLLRRMAEDQGFRDRWSRYHLISEALKNNIPERTDPGFGERVRRMVNEEAAHAGNTSFRPERGRIRALRRPAIGLAAVASLAALAVVGFQFGSEPDAGGLAVVAVNPAAPLSASSATLVHSEDTMIRKLQPYVQDHYGRSAYNPMRGSVPYVRLVSHNANAR